MTVELLDAAWVTNVSVSCLETAFWLSRSVIAAGVGLGQASSGFRGSQIGAGLKQLLVYFRRADHGQQLPLADMRADVEIPLAEIAIGTGIERGIAVGINVTGQNKLLPSLTCRRWPGNHVRSSQRVCLIFERGAGANPGNDPQHDQDNCHNEKNHNGEDRGPARQRWRVGCSAMCLVGRGSAARLYFRDSS